MSLTHNSKTADNEPAWSDVDKTKLPRIAHAEMGEPDKKSTWGYPHHFVRNGEVGKDEYGNEVYVSGDMYLHEGGLDAAWAAAQGARSGEKASEEVREHLDRHRKALKKDEEGRIPTTKEVSGLIQGPWAITAEGLSGVRSKAQAAVDGLLTDEGVKPQGTELTSIRGDVAIIEVIGPIFHYENILTMIFGLPSAIGVAQEYRKALENPEINRIILWIDSPGGQLGGISELATLINTGKKSKETVAYIGDFGASAAYWIASAASEVVATDTAQIGSIGAIMGVQVREDEDNVLEIVSTQSPRKRPDPRTDEGLQQLQQRIDALGEVFIGAVSQYRNMERDRVVSLQGDVAIAERAIDLGLADRTSSLEALIESLSNNKTDRSVGMDITAQNIKEQYPKVAEELTGNVKAEGKEEGKTEGKQEQQQADLALVEAILGSDAKAKVEQAMNSGLSAEQLKAAQGILGSAQSGEGSTGSGSGSGGDASRQQVLDEIETAHGGGVNAGGSGQQSKETVVTQAEQMRKEAGELNE